MWRIVANAILFDIAWLVCVLASNVWMVGGFTLLNLILHLGFIADQRREWLWVLAVSLLGIALDTLLFQFGMMENPDGSGFPPFWLCCLWVNFAMAIRYCFSFLQRSIWLPVILGAVAGPFSYFTGATLNGGVTLAVPLFVTLFGFAVIWGLFLPLLVRIAQGPIFSGHKYA